MTPVEEVMRAFDDVVRQGKVLYIGVSDAPAWWIAQANTIADLRGWTRFVGLQIEYSLAGGGKRLKHRPAGTQTKVCATGYQSLTST